MTGKKFNSDQLKEFKMNPRTEISLNKDKINMEKHLVETKHICSICQKGFTLKSHLDSHLLSHSRDRSYQCRTCDKQFKHKHNLNRHMLNHSGERLYECPTCQKRFIQKGDWNEHLKIHSGNKPYECPTCLKQFRKKNDLNRHMLIHSGDKPYECPACLKQFRKKNDLKRHMLIHSGDKPYECPTCQKRFRRNSELNRHILIHSDARNDSGEISSESPAIICSKDQTLNDKIVKTKTDADLEPNKSFCFEVPIIKQEIMTEEDLESPSCSYQTLDVKQEPTENADPSCLNLCDVSFIKAETELPTTI